MVTSAMTATTFLRGYLTYLKQAGWEVALVCAPGEGLEEFANAEGIALHTVAMRRDPSPLRDAVALFQVTVLLRRLRPDILVYATPKASLVGAVAGSLAGVRTRVYEVWGLRLETATGLARALLAGLERATARLSTVCIANSPSLAVRIGELRVHGGHEVVVLGGGSSHGVDSEHFRRGAEISPMPPEVKEKLSESARPVVGYVGRVHPDKGVDVLLDALALLAERTPEFQVLLVGSHEGAEIQSRLERLRRVVPVHATGHLGDVRAAMVEMQVLVLPSRREGFPNVVLEAAAMEVPAIVSDATGARDSVVPGSTGLVVPVDNAAALADAIYDVITDEAWRGQLGRQARSHAIEHFKPEDVWALHSNKWASAHELVRSRRGR